MNYVEATHLLDRLSACFPMMIGSNIERRNIYLEKLVNFDQRKAAKAVEDLIENFTAARGPSVADLMAAINWAKVAPEGEVAVCSLCGGDGWVFTKELHKGQLVEFVKDCVCTPRRKELKIAGPAGMDEGVPGWLETVTGKSKTTISGDAIATQEQAKQAYEKGLERYIKEQQVVESDNTIEDDEDIF